MRNKRTLDESEPGTTADDDDDDDEEVETKEVKTKANGKDEKKAPRKQLATKCPTVSTNKRQKKKAKEEEDDDDECCDVCGLRSTCACGDGGDDEEDEEAADKAEKEADQKYLTSLDPTKPHVAVHSINQSTGCDMSDTILVIMVPADDVKDMMNVLWDINCCHETESTDDECPPKSMEAYIKWSSRPETRKCMVHLEAFKKFKTGPKQIQNFYVFYGC